MDPFKIEGFDVLQKKLEALPRNVVRKILRGPMFQAANIVREAMVEGAPKHSGFLSEHFNVRIRIIRGELACSAYIGPAGRMYYPGRGLKEKGVSTGKRPHKGGLIPVASVARFLEFGTSKMPAKPFMRQAFESTKDRALQVIVDGLKSALSEEAVR